MIKIKKICLYKEFVGLVGLVLAVEDIVDGKYVLDTTVVLSWPVVLFGIILVLDDVFETTELVDLIVTILDDGDIIGKVVDFEEQPKVTKLGCITALS